MDPQRFRKLTCLVHFRDDGRPITQAIAIDAAIDHDMRDMDAE
jgi:hypothetical protein